MGTLFTALGVVFVAEFGDKTQLVAMSLGARHHLRQVIIGLAIAYVVSSGLAAVVGGLLGAALPERALSIGGGIAFIGFAVFELIRARGEDADADVDDDGEVLVEATTPPPPRTARSMLRSPIALIAFTVTVAELGDKTQLTTATLAARSDPVYTWAGATLGLMASGVLGALIGRELGDRLPRRALSYVSAGLFLIVGIIMIATALS
ncbi:MAG: TMEM165/GDT1 family protein [Actinomycetota bacterium]|nr:TMEM165/GDT1 family protein [Actinomycetota bacterium]